MATISKKYPFTKFFDTANLSKKKPPKDIQKNTLGGTTTTCESYNESSIDRGETLP